MAAFPLLDPAPAPATRAHVARWLSWRSETAACAAVIVLAAGLRLWELDDTGQNLYYAAAVRSMLDSWHNWFYVSFDPSGALMVDKPPLGLWLQAGAAELFGFRYWVLALPQAACGAAAVGVLYAMARRAHGRTVGLLAACLLAVMPASVASARNNSLDTITMLLMLLSAWFALKSLETHPLRNLVLAAVFAGLAFNTKMFAAFVPLPAMAVMVFRAGGRPGRRELARVGIALGVLVMVSLSWVTAVAMTPARDRPVVYNGYGNSIWALTFRYNGLNRVLGNALQERVRATGGYTGVGEADLTAASQSPSRSPWRLFAGTTGTQIGWLLPAALLGLGIQLASWRRGARASPAEVLWASWLLTGLALFSAAGDLKPQYLEAMAAPVAVEAAVAIAWLAEDARGQRAWLRPAALVALALHAAALFWVAGNGMRIAGLVVPVAAGLACLAPFVRLPRAARLGLRAAPVAVLLAGPLAWSVATAVQPQTGSAARYPLAGPGELRRFDPAPGGDLPGAIDPAVDPALAYLQAETAGQRYLVLKERALFGNAARYILQTNRPVLTLDSFQDEQQAADAIAKLVGAHELRFLELPAEGPWSDPAAAFGTWFLAHCRDVTAGRLPLDGSHLFDCQ